MAIVVNDGSKIPAWPEPIDPDAASQRPIWFALDDLVTAGLVINSVAFSVSDAALLEIVETVGPVSQTESGGTAFTTVYGAMVRGKGINGNALLTARITIDDPDFTEHDIADRSVRLRIQPT